MWRVPASRSSQSSFREHAKSARKPIRHPTRWILRNRPNIYGISVCVCCYPEELNVGSTDSIDRIRDITVLVRNSVHDKLRPFRLHILQVRDELRRILHLYFERHTAVENSQRIHIVRDHANYIRYLLSIKQVSNSTQRRRVTGRANIFNTKNCSHVGGIHWIRDIRQYVCKGQHSIVPAIVRNVLQGIVTYKPQISRMCDVWRNVGAIRAGGDHTGHRRIQNYRIALSRIVLSTTACQRRVVVVNVWVGIAVQVSKLETVLVGELRIPTLLIGRPCYWPEVISKPAKVVGIGCKVFLKWRRYGIVICGADI